MDETASRHRFGTRRRSYWPVAEEAKARGATPVVTAKKDGEQVVTRAEVIAMALGMVPDLPQDLRTGQDMVHGRVPDPETVTAVGPRVRDAGSGRISFHP